MSKVADYLRNHLRGEVITSTDARTAYSRDSSILSYTPLLVVHPFDINDIRKIVHFAWQLSQKKYTLPVTVRGGGSNMVGSAIGSGVIIDCSTHMNEILEIDTKQRLVRVQPGVNIATLQQTLRTHGLEWPIVSEGANATVGGVIGHDIIAKNGTAVSDWIDQLELVLPNGDVIQAGSISKREVGKKKGLSSSEGDIYRQIDGLLNDSNESDTTIELSNNAYNLSAVRDGRHFSLLPLITGSEGTLGIISEVILKLDTFYPEQEVLSVCIPSFDTFDKTMNEIRKQNPLTAEFIPNHTVMHARGHLGVSVGELVDREDESNFEGIMFIKFAGPKAKKAAKKTGKICDKAGYLVVRSDQDYDAAREIWQIHDNIKRSILLSEQDHKKPLPILNDATIGPQRVIDFGETISVLEKKHRVKIVWWGNVLTGVMNAYPFLNLHLVTDRQKIHSLMSDFYQAVLEQGGMVAGACSEGRLRAHYVQSDASGNASSTDTHIKEIFDENNLLNPSVKVNVQSMKDIEKHLAETFDASLHTR
jgi:FAD/FMN-containing dehydrogenase